MDHLRLRLLVDDEPRGAGLSVEHGFACWVSTEAGALLFDTGAGGALLANAERLGVELSTARAIVLSHGHYDHTGGLAALLGRLTSPRVIAHPDFDGPHRSRSTGVDRDIGVPEAARRALAGARVERVRAPTELLPGVWATGEIPRTTGEDVGGPFFLDQEGQRPDPLLDDQALLLRHRAGLVVLLGCAHAGLSNTLRYARRLFPGTPLLGVVGGMHLRSASAERLEAVAEELAALEVGLVAPAHCSGDEAKRRLAHRFGERYRAVVVGSTLQLGPEGQWGSQ